MTIAALAARLPDPPTLIRWSQSLAMLDAVVSPEWQYRYFSFDSAWSHDQQMASMRNGSGDEYSIVFTRDGTFARGFDHESELSPYVNVPPQVRAGLIDSLPTALAPLATEPAFGLNGIPSITVTLWRMAGDISWSYGVADGADGAQDDGGSWLFAELDGTAQSYLTYASEYFERDVDPRAVQRVLDHVPLTASDVAALNPAVPIEDLRADITTIGYPTR